MSTQQPAVVCARTGAGLSRAIAPSCGSGGDMPQHTSCQHFASTACVTCSSASSISFSMWLVLYFKPSASPRAVHKDCRKVAF